jgi:hypothetical protein
MHPTADTQDFIYIHRLGRRVMPGVRPLHMLEQLMKILLILLKLLGVWIVSYLLGAAVSAIYWGFTSEIGGGFEWFVEAAAWSFPVFVIAFPLVYLPSMFGLRWVLSGVKPVMAFPMVAGVLYLVPTAMMFLLYKSSDWFQAMFSSQNIAHHIMFLAASIFFGLGFVAVLSKRAAQQRHAPDAPSAPLL